MSFSYSWFVLFCFMNFGIGYVFLSSWFSLQDLSLIK